MADMELVIKLPEDVLKRTVFNREFRDLNDCVTTIKALEKAVPLPKGHGRLIDADELKAKFQEHHDFYIDAYGGFSSMPIKDKSRVDEITGSIASVVNAPTIIEADKGE